MLVIGKRYRNQIAVLVDDELFGEIVKLAHERRVSRSELVRDMLEQILLNRKDNKPIS